MHAAAHSIEAEPGSYRVVNFYHLVDVPHPHHEVAQHREWLSGKDVHGRIYISTQGINAQLSGPSEDAEGYARWTQERQVWQGLRWNSEAVDSHQFPKLRLKFKPNLVQLSGGMTSLPITDPEDGSTAAALADSMGGPLGADQHQPVLLDLRNGYEWDAGHFHGAARPLEVRTLGCRKMLCKILGKGAERFVAAGIRCDIYSTYLRRQGFNNLFTLEGGVQNYLKQAGGDMWIGSLFVFDERLAIPPPGQQEASRELPAAVPCVCGQPAALPHLNCANVDCNRLFLACSACQAKLSGCCCEACMQAPRLLRPHKPQGYYGTYDQYLGFDSSQVIKLAQ
eukprot:jgi/Astpho2/295/e_gw1.00010.86.1_t